MAAAPPANVAPAKAPAPAAAPETSPVGGMRERGAVDLCRCLGAVLLDRRQHLGDDPARPLVDGL